MTTNVLSVPSGSMMHPGSRMKRHLLRSPEVFSSLMDVMFPWRSALQMMASRYRMSFLPFLSLVPRMATGIGADLEQSRFLMLSVVWCIECLLVKMDMKGQYLHFLQGQWTDGVIGHLREKCAKCVFHGVDIYPSEGKRYQVASA